VEQRERRERDLPVPPPLVRLSHREVVRERHEGHPRRGAPSLHRERDRRYALLLDDPAYQPHGPVTQGSGGREQYGVHPILDELPRHLGGSALDQRFRVVYGTHKGEMPPTDLPHNSFSCEPPKGP
jgi:hypothetical protein